MSITWPTKEQIRASILALWQAERPTADSTKYSDLWLFARIGSVLVYRLHRTIKQSLDAVFPTTSFEAYLDSWLSWLGLPDGQGGFGRILPHISAATDGLTCSATGGGPGVLANAWQNQTLTDTAGNSYVCTEAHGAIGAGNSIDLDVESVDTGFTVNLESGTVLTWDAPPAGSDSTATLAKDLVGGTTLEEDSAGRTRLLGRLRNPPASGNVASWVSVIEAVQPGTLRAYVWPQRQNGPLHGFGLTDFMAIKNEEAGTDRFILAADDLYTEIDDAVSAGLPALIYRNSRQLLANGIRVDCDITIELGSDSTAEQRCDWDAEGNKTTVNSNDAGGPNVLCNANVCAPTITDGLEVGHKVVINGVEGEVTAVNVNPGANPARFSVTTWPAGWGTALNSLANYNVTSGGGFIGQKTDYTNNITGSGCVGAIGDHIDAAGPNVDYGAAQSRIPGWDSSIRIQQLESKCFVIGGGVIVEVTVDDLDGGAVTPPVIDLVHAQQVGNSANTYYTREITIWQVFV